MNTYAHGPHVLAFTKVHLPGGWLGNMAPFPVEHEGQTYRTTEAFFQALRFQDPAVRAAIRAQPSPMSAKMVAKRHLRNPSALRYPPRSPADLAAMRYCLQLKLAHHPALVDALRATGDRLIVEDATRRRGASAQFWGGQLGADGVWRGGNNLGVLWMELRNDLK